MRISLQLPQEEVRTESLSIRRVAPIGIMDRKTNGKDILRKESSTAFTLYTPMYKCRLKTQRIYLCIFIYLFFNCFSSIVFCLFHPPHPHHPSPPHLPSLFPPPSLVIVHMSFIIVPVNPSPFSPIIPTPSPLVTVSLFSISMSLAILC